MNLLNPKETHNLINLSNIKNKIPTLLKSVVLMWNYGHKEFH